MILQKSKQCFKNQCWCKKATNSKTLGQGRRLRLLLPVQYLTKCDVWSQYVRQSENKERTSRNRRSAKEKKKKKLGCSPR